MEKSYVIIGGMAGGISAAARLRRLDENAKITVIEKNEYAAVAVSALPYCIGGVVCAGDIAGLQKQREITARYAIECKCRHEATAIDRRLRTVTVRDLDEGKVSHIKYDKLVIATGTTAKKTDVPGAGDEGIFTLKSLRDMETVLAYIEEKKVRRAAVIGGGGIGLEAAENLASRGIKTCVIESSSHVLPGFDDDMAQFARRALEDNSVALMTNTQVLEFESTDEGIRLFLSKDRTLFADIVIVCTGVVPEASLAKTAGLGIGVTGGIIVNEHQQTTDKDIYAVGDVVELESVFGGKILASAAASAIRQGRVAADNICGIGARFKQWLGVSAVKVFDTHMASAGLSEKQLNDLEIRFEKIYVSGVSREPYYSGAKPIVIKLLFDKKNGRIFGAQIVGEEGVDKRIDVLATAMRAGMTADKLCDLELAYAPPFGMVKDPITMAGYIAADVMSGLSETVHWHDIKTLGDAVLLDVRSQKERDAGTLKNSLHIPFSELRGRIGELPKDKEIVVFCGNGSLSYTAERILKCLGFSVKNLCGGFSLYDVFCRKG